MKRKPQWDWAIKLKGQHKPTDRLKDADSSIKLHIMTTLADAHQNSRVDVARREKCRIAILRCAGEWPISAEHKFCELTLLFRKLASSDKKCHPVRGRARNDGKSALQKFGRKTSGTFFCGAQILGNLQKPLSDLAWLIFWRRQKYERDGRTVNTAIINYTDEVYRVANTGSQDQLYVFRPTDSCRLSIKVSLALCVSVVFTFLTFNVAGNFYDFPCCLENVCEAFARALLPFENKWLFIT